jgi:hypothetical protein
MSNIHQNLFIIINRTTLVLRLFYKLKMLAASRLDRMGWTTKIEILRPTVNPLAIDISCSAVWNPETYEPGNPSFCWKAKESRPPLERPEGT